MIEFIFLHARNQLEREIFSRKVQSEHMHDEVLRERGGVVESSAVLDQSHKLTSRFCLFVFTLTRKKTDMSRDVSISTPQKRREKKKKKKKKN